MVKAENITDYLSNLSFNDSTEGEKEQGKCIMKSIGIK